MISSNRGDDMTISRRVAAALLATGAATGLFLAPGVANADKVKNCGTVETGPGNSGFTQTETQTAACGSNSDQGEELGPVTNRGGGTPKGQQNP
jgi:hypothetical protein